MQAAAVSRSALWSARILTALVALFLLFDATHLRVGSPLFEAYIFPVLVGLCVWGGIWLRDVRLRGLFPLRLVG
jgi:hypothetical protein